MVNCGDHGVCGDHGHCGVYGDHGHCCDYGHFGVYVVTMVTVVSMSFLVTVH